MMVVHYHATVTCVCCAKKLTLGYWDMLPDLRTAVLIVSCKHCMHNNRVPYYYSFFGFILAVVLGILLPILILSNPVSIYAYILTSICILVISFYLIFRSYYGLFKKPFVAKDHRNWLFR